MPSSYNAPYSFSSAPGFGSGWTNLSNYLTSGNMAAVSGLEEEPYWDPGSQNYNDMNAVNFDAWLFGNKYPGAFSPSEQNPYVEPPDEGIDTGTGTTGLSNRRGVVEPLEDERWRRGGPTGRPRTQAR